MRAFITLFSLIFGLQVAQAQIFEPVNWSFSTQQISDDEFELTYTAKIDAGWYVYSQYLESEDGPIATSFNYEGEGHFTLEGKNEEKSDHKKEGHDAMFDMNIVKYAKKVDFVQRVKVLDYSKPIAGYLEFMTCDDERCLPPAEVDFSFTFKPAEEATADVEEAKEAPAATKEEAATETASLTPQAPSEVSDPAPSADGGGQFFDPVSWDLNVEKINDEEYDLVFKANIDKGWYVYSQFIEEDGPIPTTFYWDDNTTVSTEGDAKEESAGKVEGFDKIFEMNLVKYKNEVVFRQKVKSSDLTKPVTGAVEFMTCDDARCLPPQEIPFKAVLASLNASIGDDISTGGNADAPVITGNGSLPPPPEPSTADCSTSVIEQTGLWNIFILGFLGGLVALLTPCVFPMIPLTVSFFTKGSENKTKGITNAALYGFFILAVYLILSVPFHLMDSVNPDILNEVSTNIWLNIAFFLIFLFFAGSFFGYYELTLPESWTNKASSAEGVGGVLGIFFMALTLALVSFSCTGPILGSLLAGALTSDGGAMQLTAGMGGFGFALALPFALFAAFPSWMNTLPKSGGWLNTVKVVLGFLEVALALKFLSNADLVKRWGLLKIEPFLFLWILTFIGLGLYLFGKIKFPHDSPIKKLGTGRIAFGLLSFGFAIYLMTGFRYDEKAQSFTSLRLLSGLAPPAGYSWIYPSKCPQGLQCYKDYESGLAAAQEQGKPIMIDFTGHACVNCRKMEEHVWPENEVYNLIDEDFVLISLYVDEKIDLPADEQIEVQKRSGGTRKLRTYGNKWAYFQSENFGNNSQPWYVLLSPDGKKLLNNPVGYTPDSKEYADFLRCGLDSFEKMNQLGEK